jgi:hypothetical protein
METTSFRLPQYSGLAAVILLGFVALAHLAALPLAFAGGAREILQEEPGLLGGLYALAVLAALLFTLPASITWIVWAVRTRKNLDALGVAGLEYSPWFPVYFAVPFLNLFVPLIAVQEMWRKGIPDPTGAQGKRSKLIYVWWLFFATCTLSSMVPSLLDKMLGTNYEVQFLPLYHGAAVPAALLGSVVVWRFLKRQRMQAASAGATSLLAFAST